VGAQAAFDEPEWLAELVVQPFGVVSSHGKPAAFLRSLRTKGPDDAVSAGLQRLQDLVDVGSTLPGTGEKVEDRPVMSHIDRVGLERILQYVGDDPAYKPASVA
jgi:hypothetical protein